MEVGLPKFQKALKLPERWSIAVATPPYRLNQEKKAMSTSTKSEHDQAAETLRLTLPLMAKHKIPVTPPNYAVWYEYSNGSSEPLRNSIDTLIEGKREIGVNETQDLYQKHIVGATERRLQKTRHEL